MQYYVGDGVLDRRQCDFLPDDALRVMGLGIATADKLL
jgi:hypothetical protein